MKNLPSTIAEIQAVAAPFFTNPAVISVNVETKWVSAPLVTVFRDGTVKLKQ